MKKLNLIIYKEIIPTFFIALIILTFFAFTKEFQRFAQLLITSEGSLKTLLEVILCILPNVLYITIPISLLISIVSCFSRLSSDSEIIALKSCGISITRLLISVLKIAVILFLITFSLTVYIAPAANKYLVEKQYEIGIKQLTKGIKPRIFNEKFKNLIIYIQDINTKKSKWKGVFIARDIKTSKNQQIYLAKSGKLIYIKNYRNIQLHLENGLIYTVDMKNPKKDSITRFGRLEYPLKNFYKNLPSRKKLRNNEKSTLLLREEINSGVLKKDKEKEDDAKLEFYRRFSLPFSCLVFALLGVPLGVTTKRGGRSAGFTISLIVVFSYYLIFVYSWKAGVYYNLYPIKYGVWIANIIFAFAGIILIYITNREIHPYSFLMNKPFFSKYCCFGERLSDKFILLLNNIKRKTSLQKNNSKQKLFRFTKVLDLFVLKEYLKILFLTIVGSLLLFTIFTLFEIIDEIFANNISLSIVIEYFFFVWPMVIVLTLPLCVLISLLLCMGMLEKSNQITALKASGISLYRISFPIITVVILIAIGVFTLQEFILPYTNQRQDNLLNQIKGRKIQTFYRPEITWIIGKDGKIYNYSYFDEGRNVFADLSVYLIDLKNANLRYRCYAPRVMWDKATSQWILFNGWERYFDQKHLSFKEFVTLGKKFGETPQYFKTEMRKSNKMTYGELARYIKKLKSSGFDTLSLEVDLHKKLSYPFVNIIMLFIGLPFAFMMGRKGALHGVGISILIGIMFWGLFNIFTAIGSYGIMPPLFAAWAPNLIFGAAGFYLVLKIRT